MKLAVAGGTGLVGTYAVEAARSAGHDVVVLSRKQGVDVRTGEGLEVALHGCEAVIDALNSPSVSRSEAEEFFRATSQRLQEAGRSAGVAHIVTLSILGIDRASSYGYYQAKLLQEQTVSAGPLPVTILRAAQFHEFPAQMVSWMRRGRFAPVGHMRSQPVAARTVGEHLVRLAAERPGGTVELAGPEVHDVADLARRFVSAHAKGIRVFAVPVPGRAGKQMRRGALLAGSTTVLDGPPFDRWLQSPDAGSVARRLALIDTSGPRV